jgi:Spy/CpxP family protein refolding chaperone
MGPRTLVGVLCAANLVAGIGLGVTFDQVVLHPHVVAPHGRGHRDGERRGPGGHGRELERLTQRLDLDAAQAEQVKAILDARRPLFAQAMKEVEPKLRSLRDETDAKIRAVLRPDQAARLDELRREWEQADRARHAAPAPGQDTKQDAKGPVPGSEK